MARVAYLPDAKADLHQIWLFVVQQSQSLDRADRLIDTIDETAVKYAAQPKLGEPRPDLHRDSRCFTVQRFVVFYQPTADGIEVIQIIHGSRDVPKHFRHPRNKDAD